MQKVKVITDSASDIPAELAEKYNITIVPLKVIFKGKTYKDYYELKSDEFFTMLKETNEIPKTSMVTPVEFEEAFRKELETYDEIICITLSSNASGTYQSAVTAKEIIESENIHIIDSNSLSFGYGMAVIEAAAMALEGKSVDEICNHALDILKRTDTFFIVDGLEHLRKGGRINMTKAVIGTILDIKPILKIEDGLVVPIDKIRGKKNIASKMLKTIKRHGFTNDNIEYIGMAHGNTKELYNELKASINTEFNPKKIIETKIGSVIGTHSGPGIVGCLFVKK